MAGLYHNGLIAFVLCLNGLYQNGQINDNVILCLNGLYHNGLIAFLLCLNGRALPQWADQ
jgi:hypothetical protein